MLRILLNDRSDIEQEMRSSCYDSLAKILNSYKSESNDIDYKIVLPNRYDIEDNGLCACVDIYLNTKQEEEYFISLDVTDISNTAFDGKPLKNVKSINLSIHGKGLEEAYNMDKALKNFVPYVNGSLRIWASSSSYIVEKEDDKDPQICITFKKNNSLEYFDTYFVDAK